jgi:hypothetical protein
MNLATMTGNDIHGTACAGVMCAAGKPLGGVCGVARRCKVLGAKIFGGDDLAPPFRVAEAIRYAGHHASILSCSWSSGSPNDTIIQAPSLLLEYDQIPLCVKH